jgi:hypothetical protein
VGLFEKGAKYPPPIQQFLSAVGTEFMSKKRASRTVVSSEDEGSDAHDVSLSDGGDGGESDFSMYDVAPKTTKKKASQSTKKASNSSKPEPKRRKTSEAPKSTAKKSGESSLKTQSPAEFFAK